MDSRKDLDDALEQVPFHGLPLVLTLGSNDHLSKIFQQIERKTGWNSREDVRVADERENTPHLVRIPESLATSKSKSGRRGSIAITRCGRVGIESNPILPYLIALLEFSYLLN